MSFERMPQDRRNCLLVLLAALAGILPLLIHGCSCGHDFDFHLLNWIEVATQLSHGALHPHWAYTPALNAGEPRFVFYPPLSWYLGAVLGIGLEHLPGVSEVAAWNAVPVLFTWIALAASGLSLYRLAREFVTSNTALIASALYIANPYMMFTAYERTAYAELLAAAWMPLLVLAILRERVTVPGVAGPLALLWLTNAPAGVMGAYTLAILASMRLIMTFRKSSDKAAHKALELSEDGHSEAWRLARNTVEGTVLGLALAAFYIIPAAYERRFVQISMVVVPGLRIQDNFLFEHTSGPDAADHDLVLHTASMVAVLMLAVSAAVLVLYVLRRRRANSSKPIPVIALAMLAGGIGFLLTPWSILIWSHAPQAGFLQFPWRLLAVLAVVLALGIAGLADRHRTSPGLAAVLSLGLVAAAVFPAYRSFGQRCFLEDQPRTRLALFHSAVGTDGTDEYTPLRADNNALRSGAPPYWLADSPVAPAPATPGAGVTPSHFMVAAPRAEELILGLRDYPSWQIAVNGRTELRRTQRRDGLIALPLRAGVSTVEVRYRQTLDQTMGDAVSLLALALLASLGLWRKGISLRDRTGLPA